MGRVNRPRNARTGTVEPLPFESIPSTAFPNSVASISATVRLSASTGSMVIKLLLCGPPGEKSAARLGVNIVFLAPRGYRRRVSARLDLCSQRVALGGGELSLGQVDSKRRRRLAGCFARMMAGTATTQAAITSASVSLNAQGRAEWD